MIWNFHNLIIEGTTNDSVLRDHWQTSFASRPLVSAPPDIRCALNVVADVPPAPPGEPQFRQGNLLEYYLDGSVVTAHFPRFGQLRLDLANGTTEGQIVSLALHTYGVIEDLIAIGLSPHLRRRGMFLIHAFAAARSGEAALIVGNIGAGKTTTGMSLLNAGWKLLSNDSPIIGADGEVLSYPGVLAAYPNTYARFPATARLAANAEPDKKIIIPAEQVWPDVWLDRAPAAAIFFPQIESRAGHVVEPLSQPEALRLILPHAIEQWDKAMIPAHLALLNQLIQTAPAYRLRLGLDTSTIPAVIAAALADD
jgi:hypothetical protein